MKFIIEVSKHFFNSDTFHKGASLAYYAVFSFIPTIIIILSVFGLFFGEQAVSGELFLQLKDKFGNEAANQIQDIIKNHHLNHNNIITAIIGFTGLALNASVMFTHIRDSLNRIWSIKAKPKNSIINFFSEYLVSFLTLIASFFIIIISILINSFIIKHSKNFHIDYKYSYLYEHFFSFIVLSIVFALMFGFIGDAKINWKATLFGGIVTSLLFCFGKTGIAMYIGQSHISTTFGSASVLALLMLWVYYTSQIIFLGASLVVIISNRIGHEILPRNNAVKIEHVEVIK